MSPFASAQLRNVLVFLAVGIVTSCGSIGSPCAREHDGPSGLHLLQLEAHFVGGGDGLRAEMVAKQAPGQGAAQESTTTLNPYRKGATAAEIAGVEMNKAGDLVVFLSGLAANTGIFIFCMLVFSWLRRAFPIVYQNNAIEGLTPVEAPEGFFAWAPAAWRLTTDQIVECAGLDHGMLMEFCMVAMRILAVIGVPLTFILGPLHCFAGGDRARDDYLTKWGLGNVDDGNILFWVHAFVVWFVVLATLRIIFLAQKDFMVRRKRWLMELPRPQCTTILVESIPDCWSTDDRLKTYFEDLFGEDTIESAFVVKDTRALVRLCERRKAAELKLAESQQKKETTGVEPTYLSVVGREWKSLIQYHEDTIKEFDGQIDAEKERIKGLVGKENKDIEETQDFGASYNQLPAYLKARIHCNAGFVTFRKRKDTEMAICCKLTSNQDEFIVSKPPEPTDVIYSDLQKDPMETATIELIGYGCIIGLFWGFMPFVVGIAAITNLETLQSKIELFDILVRKYPAITTIWNALMGSMALNLFMSFLPTCLVIIFYRSFVLKAEAWLQHRIQGWYYWFLLIFVVLVTAVGSSLTKTAKALAQDPLSFSFLLARSLPYATHFYLNYLPVQWVAHGLNLLRYMNLLKFVFFKTIYDPKQAKSMAEPEDQDYYGMGSRSARFTLMVVIALVFCSLSPLVCVLSFINAFICRVVYGYLTVFAEMRKPDLGGVFWVSQLKHLQQALFIFILLMSGVIWERSGTLGHGPGAIALASIVPMTYFYARFPYWFQWEFLSLEDLPELGKLRRSASRLDGKVLTYQQPELL
eukprot:CAMPEP_0117623434 /NCGR_PEP_ID=MMETSP0784-20121206/88645_1 /TAXON_ID=39447 /ORGANISM="" /LENGTH=808 /DNA_ID=CAMNT_0005427385 /DNA_START=45 /DNA_END=2471 /DNA_ORIENTATION=+